MYIEKYFQSQSKSQSKIESVDKVNPKLYAVSEKKNSMAQVNLWRNIQIQRFQNSCISSIFSGIAFCHKKGIMPISNMLNLNYTDPVKYIDSAEVSHKVFFELICMIIGRFEYKYFPTNKQNVATHR